MPMLDITQETVADIAVLDDDVDFRNYIEDFLKDESIYTVRTFAHPRELFASCEEHVPNIVLLDMKMGDVNGDKVLGQLLARWPALCVVIVTGYPDSDLMAKALEIGPFTMISKPVDIAQIQKTVDRIVGV